MFKALLTVIHHPHNRGHLIRALATAMWWKINQLFFHLPTLVEIAPGIKIICDPSNSYGSFVVYARWPEYFELQFIYEFLEASDTFIDIGAHIGDSSLLAAAKITKGKIVACEPTPTTYLQLVTNIRLNNLEKQIVPLEKAVSNQRGSALFALESAGEVNHLQSVGQKGKSIRVKTVTIDDVIKEQRLRKVALLKIDVEGFEWEVLQGATKALKSQALETILFEVNPAAEDIENKVKKIESLLKKHAFELYSFTDRGRLAVISELKVPAKTDNVLAVLKKSVVRKRLRPWLK